MRRKQASLLISLGAVSIELQISWEEYPAILTSRAPVCVVQHFVPFLKSRVGASQEKISMAEALEHFLGQQVKIVFDDGGQVKAKYGTLVSSADGFATLETPHGTCAIRISEIIKIQQTDQEGKHYGR